MKYFKTLGLLALYFTTAYSWVFSLDQKALSFDESYMEASQFDIFLIDVFGGKSGLIIFILYSLFTAFIFFSLLKKKQSSKAPITVFSVFSLMLIFLISQSFQM